MVALVTFNPRPRIERVPLANDQFCYVIDDAVLEPERLVAFAAANAEAFHSVNYNAYPGILLPTPGQISVALNEFFLQHIRRLFDARRIVQMHSRLALVTLAPQSLRPWQTLCHCDSVGIEPRHSIQASVLYLFRDAGMGGTSFYEATRPAREIAMLFHDANTLSPEMFEQKNALGRGYMLTSNRYFRGHHCTGKTQRRSAGRPPDVEWVLHLPPQCGLKGHGDVNSSSFFARERMTVLQSAKTGVGTTFALSSDTLVHDVILACTRND
jgi:hypothetical protein